MPSHLKWISSAAVMLALVSAPARAEERSAPNSIFVEGLGPGLAYSLNYERLFAGDFGLRVGVSYLTVTAQTTAGPETLTAGLLTVPVTLDYVGIRSGNHSLELGAGATFIRATASISNLALSTSAEGSMILGTAGIGSASASMPSSARGSG
jgi:hypothetical protein